MPSTATLLLAVSLSLLAFEVSAQEAIIPATKNPYLKQIARHYSKLEYEKALKLLPKAEGYRSNKDPERLWLELMRGVLYYGIENAVDSDAAFNRVFEREPNASLPVSRPSVTLTQRFETLRTAHLSALASRQAAVQSAPPTAPEKISKFKLLALLRELEEQAEKCATGPMPKPLADALRNLYYDLSIKAQSPEERRALAATIRKWTELLKANTGNCSDALPDMPGPQSPGSAPAVSGPPRTGSSDALVRAISTEVLKERILRMKEWLVIESEKGTKPQMVKILSRLNEIVGDLESADTAHKRMGVALALDVFEVQMSTETGWRIQGSEPTRISIDKE